MEKHLPKIQLEEMNEEEMFVLVAPDGSPQISTLAPDYAMCLAFCQLLAKSGMSQHPAKLFKQGFQILRVSITMKQMGDAEAAFQAAKKNFR